MRLTRGEAWWLSRRRLGATAEEYAYLCRVSVERLRAVERDRAPAGIPSLFVVPGAAGPLTPGEYGAICRRRSGLPVVEVATQMGLSATTVKRMERDRTRTAWRLVAYWAGPPRALAPAPVRVRGPARSVCRANEDRGGRQNGPFR